MKSKHKARLSLFLSLVTLSFGLVEIRGEILTVGSSGRFARIQDALASAIENGGDHEIRVQAGSSYRENLVIQDSFPLSDLSIIGGWNESFDRFVNDPALTVVAGVGTQPVLRIEASSGNILIQGLTLEKGVALASGGGIDVSLSENAQVTILNNVLRENLVRGSGPDLSGGGIAARVSGEALLEISLNRFLSNSVRAEQMASARGGGLFVEALQRSRVSLRGNRLEENLVAGTMESSGAAAHVELSGSAVGEFVENQALRNRYFGAAGADIGVGFAVLLRNSARLDFRRNLIVATEVTGATKGVHFSCDLKGEGELIATNSLFAESSGKGVRLHGQGAGTRAQLINLTVAGHGGGGLLVSGPGLKTVTNLLLFGNGDPEIEERGLAAEKSGNLVGIDPLFSETGAVDYRLLPGSPAIDEGAPVPMSLLSPWDLAGGLRLVGGRIDVGAYEFSGSERNFFFPQVGSGRVGSIGFRTTVRLVNKGSSPSGVDVDLFDQEGRPSLLGSLSASSSSIRLEPGAAVTLESDSSGTLEIGYGRIRGGLNVEGVAIFERTDLPSGAVLYRAAVPAMEKARDFTVLLDSLGSNRTGIALVFPSQNSEANVEEKAAEIVLRLYDEQGRLLDRADLMLLPGHHLARFFDELFAGPEIMEMQGSVTLTASRPIVLTTLLESDDPHVEFPDEVPTLTTVPVLSGRADEGAPDEE